MIDRFIDFLCQIDFGKVLSVGGGAFVGALFAFASTQYHFILTNRHKRWEEHRNSLVKLELVLNEFLDMANVNISVITKFQNIQVMTPPKGMLFWGSASQLPIDRALLPNLLNIMLTNKLFSLYVKTRRINHDMETAKESYNTIRLAFIKGDILFEQYKNTTLELIKEWSDRSITGHKLLINLVSKLIAIVKILLKEDKPFKVSAFIIKRKSYEFTEEEAAKSLEKLQNEIESNRLESIKQNEEYSSPE